MKLNKSAKMALCFAPFLVLAIVISSVNGSITVRSVQSNETVIEETADDGTTFFSIEEEAAPLAGGNRYSKVENVISILCVSSIAIAATGVIILKQKTT